MVQKGLNSYNRTSTARLARQDRGAQKSTAPEQNLDRVVSRNSTPTIALKSRM